MKRVLIVGCPGAGKSTAVEKLSRMTDLPVIHLDEHDWLPGWKRSEKPVAVQGGGPSL